MILDGLLLPVRPGDKATYLHDWPNATLQPEIRPGDNVALRLDHITDVDPDCPEAIAFCAAMLPGTYSFGRPSGVTHYFFHAPGSKNHAFEDEHGKTIIELRTGHGHYTVIPPSRIPRRDDPTISDPLMVSLDIPPLQVVAEDLFHSVRDIAATVLLARHWPANGPTTRQHDMALYAAGFLAPQEGLCRRVVVKMIELASTWGQDENVTDRVRAAGDTWDRREAGDEIAGAPKLEDIVGSAVVKQLRKFFPAQRLSHPLTEMGDAECFADLYRDRARYDHRQGRWLVSDDTSGIWLPDPVEQLTQMTAEMMRVRQREALQLDGDKKKAAMAWAIKGEQRNRLTNAQALAQSVPPIADPGDNWDQEPFLLGVQNGVVDLRTGEFRKAEAIDRVTMRVRVAFDAAATCPLWLNTLAAIFAPTAPATDLVTSSQSQEMVDFMQRAIGYSITGDCRDECCFFTWGDGCNGKGTVMNTLGWLCGDYTDDMPYSTLERSDRGNGIPSDVAKLAGKRFITCSEMNEFDLNEARLKALTGRDPMTARFLHHDWFTFIPVCKIWIATNNKPKIVGQDDGIWRRIHLIPFTQKFEGRENKQLKDQLRSELPGILNWIITGARIWLTEGLNPPDLVKAATAAYRHESNPLTPFIESCCKRGEALSMQAGPAFKAYQQFCRDESVEPWKSLTDKQFAKAMRQMFKVSEGRHVWYLGVGLLVPDSEAQAGPTRGRF